MYHVAVKNIETFLKATGIGQGARNKIKRNNLTQESK